MKLYKYFSLTIVLIVLLSLGLSACSGAKQPGEPATLKMAVLPILDTLPMYVAQQEGFFDKHGVKVEFVPVQSAAERDQVIVAGQADGMINDPVAVQLYNKEEPQVQIVRYAETATPERSMFRLLAAGESDVQTVEDLKNVEIGISEGTVIQYMTERLLESQGFTPQDIKTIAVPKMSDRMALLGTGELKAAMLPEPLSSLAVQNGARPILDDTTKPEISYTTYAFRKPVIDQNPDAIRAFLAAIEEAITLINQDPQKWSSLLVEQKVVPQPIAGSFLVPSFVTAGVPSQAQWEDVLAWTKAKGLIAKDLLYKESVTDEFLP
jgi:NitT/TauT family transport system substrate-binding protein